MIFGYAHLTNFDALHIAIDKKCVKVASAIPETEKLRKFLLVKVTSGAAGHASQENDTE